LTGKGLVVHSPTASMAPKDRVELIGEASVRLTVAIPFSRLHARMGNTLLGSTRLHHNQDKGASYE